MNGKLISECEVQEVYQAAPPSLFCFLNEKGEGSQSNHQPSSLAGRLSEVRITITLGIL